MISGPWTRLQCFVCFTPSNDDPDEYLVHPNGSLELVAAPGLATPYLTLKSTKAELDVKLGGAAADGRQVLAASVPRRGFFHFRVV